MNEQINTSTRKMKRKRPGQLVIEGDAPREGPKEATCPYRSLVLMVRQEWTEPGVTALRSQGFPSEMAEGTSPHHSEMP